MLALGAIIAQPPEEILPIAPQATKKSEYERFPEAAFYLTKRISLLLGESVPHGTFWIGGMRLNAR